MPASATATPPRHRLTQARRHRLTLMGLAVAVLCAMAMLWISESTHQRIANLVTEIQDIDAVRASVTSLTSTVTNAEYEQRRYVLSGEKQYLTAYQENERLIGQRLRAMETQDSTPALADSDAMLEFKRLLARQTNAMSLTVRLASGGQTQAAQHIVDSDEDIAQMQQFRQQGTKLSVLASHIVTRKRAELWRLTNVSRVGLAAGVFAAILAFFLYVRQARVLQQVDSRQQRLLAAERDALESQVKERTARLTELANHLQQAVEEERARLARELHDELGALLTAAKLDVARLKSKLPADAAEPLERIQHLTATLNQGIALKRQIIEDLRPSALSNLGLLAALEILSREFSVRSEIPVRTAIEQVKLGEMGELTIYRLVQEALTNIGKYAKATEITVTLKNYVHHIEVTVTDDGVGFDLEQMPRNTHGLLGMRHRVEALGGQLTLDSAPGHGTRVTGTIPRQISTPQPEIAQALDDMSVQG